MYFQRVRKISRGGCSSSTAQMGIQRCVEAITEDLKHLHRDQVKVLHTIIPCEDQFYLYQKVKITIEAEQAEITESCRGNKKKENPFSRDCVFLAVSLITIILKIFGLSRILNGLVLLP